MCASYLEVISREQQLVLGRERAKQLLFVALFELVPEQQQARPLLALFGLSFVAVELLPVLIALELRYLQMLILLCACSVIGYLVFEGVYLQLLFND